MPTPKDSWIRYVMENYASTEPPHRIFTRSPQEIADAADIEGVAPKGVASWQRMVNFHRNRAGTRLSEERRKVLTDAVALLSQRIKERRSLPEQYDPQTLLPIKTAALPYRDRIEVYGLENGKILAGRFYNDQMLGPFGGGIDPGETPEEAALRELREEAGRNAVNLRRINVRPFTQEWKPPFKTPKELERSKLFRGSRSIPFAADLLPERLPIIEAGPFKNVRLRRPRSMLKDLETPRAITGEVDEDTRIRTQWRAETLRKLLETIAQTEKAATAATGIPDRSNYGDLTQLKAKQLVDWVVHHHEAERAGPHYDYRLGTPETGLFSWAGRKPLPEPGKKILAVQQPRHEHSYGDFEGEIPEGYGKGTVKKEDVGKLLITRVEPNKIHFTLAHRRYPERFVLVRPEGGIGKKENNWLLMNTTPVNPLDYPKEHYKSVPANKIEPLLDKLQPGSSVQAKIDGALTLTQLLKDKIELLSYRKSKVTSGPIMHTERVFRTIPNVEIPKRYQGSVLSGELFGTQKGQPLDPQALGGLLNASVAKSIQQQDVGNVNFGNLLFDLRRLGRRDISNRKVPYEQRMQHIKDILGSIGGPDADAVRGLYRTPEEAKTPATAKTLFQEIAGGKHPATTEGIVIHPSLGTPMKSKLFNEHDVYVRGFFPGKGKYQDKGVGGFVYSHEPDGQIAGEVGTGFSDELRADMFSNPNDYVGRRARVRTTRRLPSGALFQPSLIAMHEDYPLAPGGV